MIILVDSCIATGATMIAAVRWIRNQEPKQLLLATSVAPGQVIVFEK